MPPKPSTPSAEELLLSRWKSGSKPGKRTDPHHFVLAIESGGMAGAISGAFAAAMNTLGVECFDEVRGSSAGALVAAYFCAGRARVGASMFPLYLCDGRFLNIRRALFTRRPYMDLDFLVDEVFESLTPLDYAALEASAVPVWALATRKNGDPVYLPLHGRPKPAVQANLKATARVPVAAEGWGVFNDIIDGAMHQPIPFTAHGEGPREASHTLILRNFPAGYAYAHPTGCFARWLQRKVLALQSPALRKLMEERPARFQELADRMKQDPAVAVLAPPSDLVGLLTQRPDKIWPAIGWAYREVFRVFGEQCPGYPDEWRDGKRHLPPLA